MAIHRAIDGLNHSLDVAVARGLYTRGQADEIADEELNAIINRLTDKRIEIESKYIGIQIETTED